MMHTYYMLNVNESDNPDSTEHAVLEIRPFDAAYRSSTADGRVSVVQERLPRDVAALYLWRARERGWKIARY